MAKIILGICVAVAILFGLSKVFLWGDPTPASIAKNPESASQLLVGAHTRVAEGDWLGAREILEPLLPAFVKTPDAPRALMLMAEVEQAEGHTGAALALLEQAYTEFSDSPLYPEIAANYAFILEQSKREGDALDIYQDLLENAPPESRIPALMGMARAAERENRLVEARDMYHQAVQQSEWGSANWNRALDRLGELNVKLVFSPMETPESKHYTVESGDNLTGIGVKLNTTQGLLMLANGIDDPTRLRVGQRLKYTPKDFRIVIERATCTIYLLDKDGIFKRYKTGLGKPGHETTLGSYIIGNKQKDPTWFKPGHGPIPPDDPENELGTRWMPLVPTGEGLPTDLGIHGTIAPETIGSHESLGCARMHNKEVEELYDLVVRSTPVEIVETFDPDTLG